MEHQLEECCPLWAEEESPLSWKPSSTWRSRDGQSSTQADDNDDTRSFSTASHVTSRHIREILSTKYLGPILDGNTAVTMTTGVGDV